MSPSPLVVGLGQVELQFTGVLPRFPDGDTATEVDAISVQVGGAGAVALGAAVALGCRGRFACKLADEFAGAFILDALREAGIETRGVLTADRKLSALRFSFMDRERRRKQAYFSRGDVGEFDDRELDAGKILEDASALLIDGLMPRSQVRVAEAARERKIPVILDAGAIGDQIGELVALADVLIASERLAVELARHDDLERSLTELQRLGPGAVVITLGRSGSIGLHGDELVRQPALRGDEADTDGAGAVFHGAFAAALLSELPFARCMEFASAAAGISCTRVGPWAGIPARDEVLEAIRARR